MDKQYISYLQKLLIANNINFQSQQTFSSSLNQKLSNQKAQSKTQTLENSLNSKSNEVPLKQQQVMQNIQTQTADLLKSNIRPQLEGKLVQRYSRQMLLKQIGYEGQLKIVKSKIAIIGCGGIGCPLALYLAGAGVGQIGLFDSDKVDMTNLHRQVGHRTKFIGTPKTQSLKNCLLQLNPHIKINVHQFVTINSQKQLSNYDFIIDGSDNPECRYMVNDFSMKMNKKLLSGACIGWEGQITCYGGRDGPCYRCVWGNQQKTSGGCSTLGVIGMLPGFVGIILGVEALKLIINEASSLQGHLLTYESKSAQFRKIKLRSKQQGCIGCGQNKLNILTYDYSKNSTCKTTASTLPEVEQIDWNQYMKNYRDVKILDVRPQNQFKICHLVQSINIPYEKLAKLSLQQIKQIAQKQKLISQRNKKVLVSCNRGIMSKKGADLLNKMGIQSLGILGGITQYSKKFDQSIPLL